MALAVALGPTSPASAERNSSVRGSTSGLLYDQPYWSAGLQLGNYGGTGVAAQRLGVLGGTVNGGLGFAERGLAAHLDTILFFENGFKILKAPQTPGYNGLRGRILPYVGAGAQIGRGISLRIPAGVQYAMLKDPFNFYGGLVVLAGSVLSDDDFRVSLAVAVGARALL